jgi:pyridoxamine 5'-phosphate oxidase
MALTYQRRDFAGESLDAADLDPNPIRQFLVWYNAAVESGVPEPEACSLATATRDGRPSARMVLLRGIDARGFAFFTNYESRKAREIEQNPFAALVFYWQPLDRSVRVEGRVERTSAEESDAYFHTRPLGARIGAWASPQSRVLPDRQALEESVRQVETRFSEGTVIRPPQWGGYRVIPDAMELWQGRPDRLHDRFRYRRVAGSAGDWNIERLAP